VFSNLLSITLPNIGKYFPGIHFPRNSLSKRKLLSSKQTRPNYFKLLSDNKIERKRVEVRKIEEMDDNIRNNMASLFIIQPLTIIKKKTTKKLK
jgi:hypothetical protein